MAPSSDRARLKNLVLLSFFLILQLLFFLTSYSKKKSKILWSHRRKEYRISSSIIISHRPRRLGPYPRRANNSACHKGGTVPSPRKAQHRSSRPDKPRGRRCKQKPTRLVSILTTQNAAIAREIDLTRGRFPSSDVTCDGAGGRADVPSAGTPRTSFTLALKLGLFQFSRSLSVCGFYWYAANQ